VENALRDGLANRGGASFLGEKVAGLHSFLLYLSGTPADKSTALLSGDDPARAAAHGGGVSGV